MKHFKADQFFTSTEKEKIRNTTMDIEARTIGEVAVVVVDSSDPYLEAEAIGGMLIGSLLSLAVTGSFFHASLWWFIPLSFLCFFPSRTLVKKIPAVKAAFIGARRKDHAVEQMALRVFYEKGLYKTKKSTAVLFFLSLLERKVWVLADQGIHEKIGQERLDTFARTVSQGVKEGRSCDALCKAMEDAGALLAKHFPVTPGDTNELPDEVITE